MGNADPPAGEGVVVQTHAIFSGAPSAGGGGAITYTLRDDGNGLKVASVVFVMNS